MRYLGVVLGLAGATALGIGCGAEFSSGGGGSTGASGPGGGGTGGTGGTAVAGTGGTGGSGGGTAGTAGTGGSGGSAGTGGSGGGVCEPVDCTSPACADAGYQCAAAPSPWSGPVRLLPQGTACSGGWPTQLVAGGTDVLAAPAQCECQCAPPANLGCSDHTTLTGYAALCSGVGFDISLATSCSPSGNSMDYPSYTAVSAALVGSCSPVQSQNLVLPEASWHNGQHLCGDANSGGGCDSGQCFPPGDGELCIYQTGQHTCPDGWTATVTTLLTGFAEGRTCTCPCSRNGDCTTTIELYSGVSCGGSAFVFQADGGCHANPSGNPMVSGQIIATPSAFCLSDPAVDGSVTGIDPITVCCR